MAGRETPVDSQHRLSLLDSEWETAKGLNKKSLIHRIVFVGKIGTGHSDKNQLGEHYDKLFKSYSNHVQVEAVTGLLLIYSQYFFHVLETSNSVLVSTIKDLESKEKRGTLVQSSKILLSVGNIPSRLYRQWNYRVLNLPSIRTDETKLADPIEILVSEALVMILKLGHQLSKVPKLSLKATLDQLQEKHKELLIHSDIIERFLKTDDLCSPGAYLQRYCVAYDVTLDRDLVWPAETKLFPL